jgi:hypothetical protein
MGKKISKKEVKVAYDQVFREFFSAVLALASLDNKMKELNYIKTAITTPDGGVYLVSVLHIDGPKIDMDLFRSVSDSQKEEKSDV